MSDDPKLPKRIPGQTSVTAQADAPQMSTKPWLVSKKDELEYSAALRAEQIMRAREQNNTAYIEAQRASALAQHALDNIGHEIEQREIEQDDAHGTRMANSKAERERSLAEADTFMAEYGEKEAGHRAGIVEAKLREKRAQAELDALQAKSDGAPEQIEELKAALREMTEEEIELSEKVKSLMAPENRGDETARADLRSARAELRNIEEDIRSLKTHLRNLRGW